MAQYDDHEMMSCCAEENEDRNRMDCCGKTGGNKPACSNNSCGEVGCNFPLQLNNIKPTIIFNFYKVAVSNKLSFSLKDRNIVAVNLESIWNPPKFIS